MIESRSQAGHRRRMALSQSLAQSVSSLCCGAESGIKRIVVHWGSAAGVDLPRSEPEAELLLLNKSNRKRIKLSGYSFSGCDSESWPVIFGNPEVMKPIGCLHVFGSDSVLHAHSKRLFTAARVYKSRSSHTFSSTLALRSCSPGTHVGDKAWPTSPNR